MRDELPAAAVFTALYVLAFAAAWAVRRLLPRRPEASRKTLHLLCGIICLPAPVFFRSAVLPGISCVLFLAFLLLTRKAGRLPEVHQVGRCSIGAFLFPIGAFLLFLSARGRPASYAAGILVLSLSDTAAALVGRRFGRSAVAVPGGSKSLEGSLAFFAATWIVVETVLLTMTGLCALQVMHVGFATALLMTGVELVSPWGTDNLTVPLGVSALVSVMGASPPALCANAVSGLLVMAVIALACFAAARTRQARTPCSARRGGGR